MNLKKQNHTIDNIFIITIFLVFVMLTFIILTMGANIYKNISDSIDKRFNEVTSISYISNKIRAFDQTGKIYISQLDGINALTLEQNIENEDYTTMLYYYNGKLMELSCIKGERFSAGDGAEILSITGLEMQFIKSDLLKITVYSPNAENEMFIYINSN